MQKKRKSFPEMNSFGYYPPKRRCNSAGYETQFYTCICEGCGDTVDMHEDNLILGRPLFFKNCGGNCTQQKVLTEYYDNCEKCDGGKIYLTPGAAMYKKYQGDSYEQKLKYCDDCLDEVVFDGPCRNLGCISVGGKERLNAKFRDKLYYEKQGYTFPPNNCEVCRKIKKEFEKTPEIRPTCHLCKKPFRVTYGVMIMMLKNEKVCEVPTECVRCRNLSPFERTRIQRDKELEDLTKKRIAELNLTFKKNSEALAREKTREKAAREEKKLKLIQLLKDCTKLKRKDLRNILQSAVKDGNLLQILSNQNDPSYQELKAALAYLTVTGKSKITVKEYNALPEAFKTILEKHPNAIGIFENKLHYRAPGNPYMSAVSQHYEILMAATITQKEITSSSGKKLRLYDTDNAGFGMKFKPEYEHPEDAKIRSGKLTSIEADILIQRNETSLDKVRLATPEVIGIDTKYTQKDYYPYNKESLENQLEGIRHHFQHGNLTEFFFVTNKEFSGSFKNSVEKMNLTLVQDYIKEHNENFRPDEPKTSVESANMPQEKIDIDKLGGFKEYTEDVRDFVAKYNIKQVELCENVKYPGT